MCILVIILWTKICVFVLKKTISEKQSGRPPTNLFPLFRNNRRPKMKFYLINIIIAVIYVWARIIHGMENLKSVNNWLADRTAFLSLALAYYKADKNCYTGNISTPPPPIKAGSPKGEIITEFKHSYSSTATVKKK